MKESMYEHDFSTSTGSGSTTQGMDDAGKCFGMLNDCEWHRSDRDFGVSDLCCGNAPVHCRSQSGNCGSALLRHCTWRVSLSRTISLTRYLIQVTGANTRLVLSSTRTPS